MGIYLLSQRPVAVQVFRIPAQAPPSQIGGVSLQCSAKQEIVPPNTLAPSAWFVFPASSSLALPLPIRSMALREGRREHPALTRLKVLRSKVAWALEVAHSPTPLS